MTKPEAQGHTPAPPSYFDVLIRWLETVEGASTCRYTRIGAEAMLEQTRKEKEAHAFLKQRVEKLEAAMASLLRCSNAIVGAYADDPRAAEAFDMFNDARDAARLALSPRGET